MALSRRSVGLGIFGLVFCAFALVFSGFIGWGFFRQWRASGEFVATPADVERSEVIHKTTTKDGKTRHSYEVHVAYSYSFGGARYTSDRFSFMSAPSYSSRDVAEGVVQLYTPGSSVTAYVNPESPGEAVLDREWSWGTPLLAGLVLSVFFAVGCVFAYFGFAKVEQHTRETAIAQALRKKPPQIQKGFVALKVAGRQRVAKGAFALFWNIITWTVIIAFVIDRSEQQDAQVWVYGFMALFAGIGLVLLWFMVVVEWLLARQFQPPQLSVSHSPVSLGDSLSVQYRQLISRAIYLQSITVSLVHTEEYWVKRGKSSHRQVNVLWSDAHALEIESLCQPGQQFDFVESFAVPVDAMCSMNYNGRDYLWKFEVKICVKNSPDYSAAFPLEVFPQAAAPV